MPVQSSPDGQTQGRILHVPNAKLSSQTLQLCKQVPLEISYSAYEVFSIEVRIALLTLSTRQALGVCRAV